MSSKYSKFDVLKDILYNGMKYNPSGIYVHEARSPSQYMSGHMKSIYTGIICVGVRPY